MNYSLSEHAKKEINIREIPIEVFEKILFNPQQIIPGFRGTFIYQSKIIFKI